MDLDHVRGTKEFKISEAVHHAYGASFERLYAEIAKCEVVCANCHRLRTDRAIHARESASG
jgi:hypothetical protein